MKNCSILKMSAFAAAGMLFVGSTYAGSDPISKEVIEPADPFAKVLRPISNPTLFDLALPRTTIHPVFMTQSISDKISTILGDVPVGGDFQLYALQLEYAFNERLSFVATKDGYIDFNPDSTLSNDDGWANLAAGLKYALLYQPEQQHVLSVSIVAEAPTGNTGVFQGTGDGALNVILSDVKLLGRWQLAGALGAHIPFDNGTESTTGFASAHASYWLNEWLAPLVEVNWYRVLDSGDGGNRFGKQLGGAVPAVVEFEGGDLINMGSANAGTNRDIVTLAAGFRVQVAENVSLGAAYEIPLTSTSTNLMQNRVTVDLVWTF